MPVLKFGDQWFNRHSSKPLSLATALQFIATASYRCSSSTFSKGCFLFPKTAALLNSGIHSVGTQNTPVVTFSRIIDTTIEEGFSFLVGAFLERESRHGFSSVFF